MGGQPMMGLAHLIPKKTQNTKPIENDESQ
jgi:hypothetical protein